MAKKIRIVLTLQLPAGNCRVTMMRIFLATVKLAPCLDYSFST